MSKITITIADAPDGEIDFKMEFDPPLDGDAVLTPAQGLAYRLIETANAVCTDGHDLQIEFD